VLLTSGHSDTTASALVGMFYFLTSHPIVYKKLQCTLDAVFPSGDAEYANLAASYVPYLDAVINETLRLQPPVPVGPPRETPPEGITVDGVYIPGNTIVSVPIYSTSRDERYYERPLEFIPERWTEECPELVKDKSVFMPFTLGELLSSSAVVTMANEWAG
jgi:cytochrome P450